MTFVKVKSGGIWGIEGYEVDVEVDISPGLPSFNIVGLPDSAIKESRDRVRSAIKNLGFSFPQKRITVNLSPSHIRKQGTLYDLPITVGILTLGGYLDPERVSEFVFLGEVSLDGKLSRVNGVLPVVASLRDNGFVRFVLPLENSLEGAVIDGTEIYGFESISDLIEFINGGARVEPVRVSYEDLLSGKRTHDIDLGDVLGQSMVKKALEISAAGAHNLSMIGAPGSGKSMLAKRVVTILPPLEFEEMLEVSRIYSVAGLLGEGLITERPFRSPHHTASEVALIGGGSIPLPGEISLAHKGVLFLDELPEFSRKTLEVLRQPMEDGCINIARAQGRVRFPASFTLITAQNPCPCGNFGNPYKECTCTQNQIRAYNSKVSQPLKDRIDLRVWVDPVKKEELVKGVKGETSAEVTKRVLRAYEIQRDRFRNSKTDFNGRMTNREVERFCLSMMKEEAKRLLKDAIDRLNLSGRGYFRTLKVARTIADLEGSEPIEGSHIAQALQFRVEENAA
ncbi:magnesium chelatase family protein [Hydrogenivirga caldilitoris]|uniref:Magnesium chelatase family protein n=1 Tax=Hydrogenivirga caldilitoris TaxID=246264 RepID=A0A497XQJ6_9AQUI|nr:YifB family Mg chelatase-like AAA ATPase [Hydrogenivirga caldilitoris]RLJ70430.1 magnesium chelatase family protein [Hydrogenivirga caldilitoris]